jgi:MoaA/NifB/PqqE/SkfB family radical SAM enzyme
MSPTSRADRPDAAAIPGVTDDPFLLLHYTLLCNASCAHCVVEGGPRRTGRMPLDLARQLIEGGAGADPRLSLVVFSGGESFIYLDDVLGLCEVARAAGMRTRIITNGYWAKTPEAAAAMLERLADRAVDELVVSFGEFHREYIPMARVRHVFLGARQAGRAPIVTYSTVNASRIRREDRVSAGGFVWPEVVFRVLTDYGFDASECVPMSAALRQLAGLTGEARAQLKRTLVHERAMINWQSLAFGGRATKELNDRVPLHAIEDDPGPPCAMAGRQITALTNGRVYPCCSAWSNFPDHAIGTARTAADVPTLVAAAQQDPLVRFIHDRGPGTLIRSLRRAGASIPAEYSDICHMCQTLFERFSLDDLRRVVATADDPVVQFTPAVPIAVHS